MDLLVFENLGWVDFVSVIPLFFLIWQMETLGGKLGKVAYIQIKVITANVSDHQPHSVYPMTDDK